MTRVMAYGASLRTFLVTASVTFSWIDLFRLIPYSFWSDNLLSGIKRSRYSGISMPWYVGEIVSGGCEVGLNCGIVGTGFANAGFLGVIFLLCTHGPNNQAANSLVEGGVPPFMTAVTFVSSIRISIADADFFIAVLSHGIAVGLVMLWLHGFGQAGPVRKSRLLYAGG